MKISQRTAPSQATGVLAVGLIAIPAVMGAGHPAPSHSASAPSHSAAAPSHSAAASASASAHRAPALTISVSDGHVTARAGDKLTYTVSVRNSGAVAVPHLTVTQDLPSEVEFLSAGEHGTAARGHVSWPASSPAGGTRTFRVVTRVTTTPATLLRLAAVACATLPGSSRPVVCAAHLDRLPAAAAAASPPARSAGNVLAYTAGGLIVVVLALLTAIVIRRRGRLRRQPA